MTTGEKIREARLNAGFTQKRLSELTGIAESTIRKYESNRLNPKKETLEKIALPLGTNYLDLYGDEARKIYEKSMEFHELAEQTKEFFTEYANAVIRVNAINVLGGENVGRIVAALDLLNPAGQEIAIERVEELTEIPKYKRERPTPAPQSTPAEDSAPPSDTPETPPEDE